MHLYLKGVNEDLVGSPLRVVRVLFTYHLDLQNMLISCSAERPSFFMLTERQLHPDGRLWRDRPGPSVALAKHGICKVEYLLASFYQVDLPKAAEHRSSFARGRDIKREHNYPIHFDVGETY
jgi:hypothetical protein